MRAFLVLALLALPGCFAPVAEDSRRDDGLPDLGPDVVWVLDAAGARRVSGHADTLQLATNGTRAWNVTTAFYTVVELRVDPAALPVARTRQILPLWYNATGAQDEHFFVEVVGHDLKRVDNAAFPLYNATLRDGAHVLRLGFPAGTVRLTIEADTRPPALRVGPVEQLTTRSFLLTTRTDEWAFADLQVRREDTAEWIPNPTTIPALAQTFPIQGLRANSSYEARILAWDWAGNVNASPSFVVRTPPEPVKPKPVVTPLAPADGAHVPTSGVVVRARIESPESPLAHVRLFFDNQEVGDGFTVANGELEWATSLARQGLHKVSVEATNAAGGTGVAVWTFTSM